MFAVSQIIEKNFHRNEVCSHGLWINPEKDDCWRKAETSCHSLKLVSQDYGAFAFLKQTGAEAEFRAFPRSDVEKYQWIILNLPRQKALLHMLLECAASLLAADGILWLAGENKAGIKSADKILKKYFGRVRKLDNARHCTLFEARESLAKQAFDPATHREQWRLDCKPTPIEVVSYPGVFAHGRVDAGTALLLNALTKMRIEGEVLDFACGAGLIGACIAAGHQHASVTLLDTSALALKACEETLANNHLNGSVLASDGLSELKLDFDLVVSNPPIHAGVKTDSRLSLRLLDSVHDHLNPGGRLILVANVHLPYEKWLSQRFSHCSELATNSNYKVLLAKKMTNVELSLDGKVESFELKPVALKKEYKMRKIFISSIITGSMALFLLNACADNSGDTPTPVSGNSDTATTQESSIMDQPVDFSTPENVEISLQKVKDQEGEKTLKTLNSAMQYILFYDLSLGNDKEKLYKSLDGSTPREIIAKMKRR